MTIEKGLAVPTVWTGLDGLLLYLGSFRPKPKLREQIAEFPFFFYKSKLHMTVEYNRPSLQLDLRDWNMPQRPDLRDRRPEPAQWALNLRDRLGISSGEYDVPAMPDWVKNVPDMFTAAELASSVRWNEIASGELAARCQTYADLLKFRNGHDGPNLERDIDLLDSPRTLNQRLQIGQFDLGPAKSIIPDAWLTLLLAAHRRQEATVGVLSRWVTDMTEGDARKLHATTLELTVTVKLAEAALSLNIAFIKQEMTDLQLRAAGRYPDRTTPPDQSPGSSYVYALRLVSGNGSPPQLYLTGPESFPAQGDTKKIRSLVLPYAKVFRRELAAFASKVYEAMDILRANPYALASSGELHDYLLHLVKLYTSPETDLKKLEALWDNLSNYFAELQLSASPLLVVPQGDTAYVGDISQQIIPEQRLTTRSDVSREMDEYYQNLKEPLLAVIQNLARVYDPKSADRELPDVTFAHLLLGTGPNLHWRNRGEQGNKFIDVYLNVIIDTFGAVELPLLIRMFPEVADFDQNRLLRAAAMSILLHELGHRVILSTYEEDVARRIPASANTIDEVKAETVGMLILKQCQEAGLDLDYEYINYAMFGRVFDALLYKSIETNTTGARYSGLAAFVVNELVEKHFLEVDQNSLRFTEETDSAVRMNRVREVLADAGDRILRDYYAQTGDVKYFESTINQLNHSPLIMEVRRVLAAQARKSATVSLSGKQVTL